MIFVVEESPHLQAQALFVQHRTLGTGYMPSFEPFFIL